MKKFNVWIIFAILGGVLCVGVLALYGYVLIVGRDFYGVVGDDLEADTISSNAIAIDTDFTRTFKEISLDSFKVSYGEESSQTSLETDGGEVDSELNNAAEGEESGGEYIIPDSDKRKLTESDLEDLSPQELTYARNEIYARHGRKFQSSELQDYFDSKDWYEPNESFDDHDLQGVERENAEYISEYQKDTGKNYKVK